MDKQPGWGLWLTGLPASGKTTVARALKDKLSERGVSAVLLDSDEVQRMLVPNAAYASADREQFYVRLAGFAAWLARAGEHVIIAATGSRRSYRAAARSQIEQFAEVWVSCPAEICRARDPKELYAHVAAGTTTSLPGSDAAYEPPEAAEAIVDTSRQTPEQAVEIVLMSIPFLREKATGRSY